MRKSPDEQYAAAGLSNTAALPPEQRHRIKLRFASAAPAAILAPMPTLEINATQYRLNSQSGIVTEIIGNADQLHRTRILLLPRLLSGQIELGTKGQEN